MSFESAVQIDQTRTMWFLFGAVASGSQPQNIPIDTAPLTIGRGSGNGLRLQYRTVSSQHAVINEVDDRLVVTDLGSTNGTFVNGRRISQPTTIGEEDLIHFADATFRIRCQTFSPQLTGTLPGDVCDQALSLVQFDRMMSERLVLPHFQPIVNFDSRATIGHEILGRSQVFGLETPGAMFGAAKQLDLEVELSQLLRWEGIRIGRAAWPDPLLFFNTHPKELQGDGLIESLKRIRELAGSTRLVLEVHEAAITCVPTLNRLSNLLAELDIDMAYDDFGTGQARLSEIVGTKPKYVKFDIGLIRGIDQADPHRLQMLKTLVTMVKDLEILSLAEGVETAGEAEACQDLGFELAQGYYFGRPAPATLAADKRYQQR